MGDGIPYRGRRSDREPDDRELSGDRDQLGDQADTHPPTRNGLVHHALGRDDTAYERWKSDKRERDSPDQTSVMHTNLLCLFPCS